MQKKSFRLFVFTFVAFLQGGFVWAGGENNISALKSSWKNPVISYCQGSNVGNATIGRDRDICKGNYDIEANSPSQCVLIDDMGMLMLMAREVNERGARFCPTTVYAEKEKKGNAWTLYAEPAQGAQPCYWLCKPGYSGEGCNDTRPNGCDSVPLKREDFSNLTMARDPQVESSVAMFYWNDYQGCGLNKGQEHDVVLVISGWLSDGHGAYATPYVIRARRVEWKSRRGGIDAWPAGDSTLLCKNGYTANEAGDDCVPVDETVCGLTQTCSGWPSADFDETSMILHYNERDRCYQYRCRDAGYAFLSASDKVCQPCSEKLRGGASPSNGTCIECPVGQVFDENAQSTGYCSPTDAFNMSDLQYGTGHTKETPVEDQCWTILEAGAYSDCVKGIKNSNTEN